MNFKKYILLLSFYILTQALMDWLVLTDEVIYDSLINQISYNRITELLDQGKKWRWVPYIFLPLLITLKIVIVLICFSIGALLANIQLSLRQIFSVCIISEFIFLIPAIIKLLWFLFIKTDYTLQDLHFFSPLSMISLFNPTELDPWLVYPIQLLNVFELLYWIALAWQLQEVLEKPFAESFGFVAKTYGVGLAVWVVVVMFLTVSIS